ncbi:MAG: hypothetical protein UU08_C0005G0009 [Candidatus Uhrbacteria bacterium GW2011_GWE2_40_58]|nr:MAG: hypothetical protein UT94_C0005G0009 [Candidatus Uhrbacteria bacterium GW2011_GWF2_40_263]KKR67959.1 MAG: hypothetical protein UU08_C0005G0009 [Candidatus Uhrbacteria bacterium GW2011_GWE2_40_58]OGL92405.1 MAG: hypothetical protein A2239_02155 [Candidatus Uhrbacteria bacterium RIFOXYA2_FULL_40_9]OGL96996.1 MAG: hypothetical protein A2332_03960 [Candidatus Uhrbacteria bacterium RIFOXYB2_FULL_41_18]HBK34766.1 hypothetical protein [Candidatus Uhrbacteria bacterium]
MKKKNLLLIDQDAFLAGIYGSRLSASGWNVFATESIEQANQLIKKRKIDVVLIDPETIEGALTFFQELRANPKTQDTLLVVLTELGNQKEITEAYQAGADAYLLKGHFVPSEVSKKLSILLEQQSL